MSQTYEQRRITVEAALKTQGVQPAKGRTVAEAAIAVLDALDSGKEHVR